MSYLLFLPLITGLNYLCPRPWRWSVLLFASCYFYAVFIPRYLLILFFIILVDYASGLVIESAQGLKRKIFLGVSLMTNCAVLFVFKYFDFFAVNTAKLGEFLGWSYSPGALGLLLPIGLSFHTFQAMSYTLEVYYGRQRAERHLGIYALYVLFFPQLVAGPIERPQNLLPQLHAMRGFNSLAAVTGLRLILWGIFKKAVLADRLGVLVDAAYGGSWQLTTGLAFIIANICFAFQIYYDFSGYSDIARGSARILGVELMKNFDFPYFSTSVAEFWRRWHISLSNWFRDYIFIPLGGSRGSRGKTLHNLFIVFLLSGLWHGANFTFLAWGLLHFFYIAVLIYCAEIVFPVQIPKFLKCIGTFFWITLAWVFFRASDVAQISEILSEMTLIDGRLIPVLLQAETLICLSLIALTTLAEYFWFIGKGEVWLENSPRALRWGAYYAMTLAVFIFGVFKHESFIYFQF